MGKTAKVLLTLIIVIAVLACGTLVASGVYANSIDTVYPNVSLNGTDLSRMSIEQARQALVSAGYENNAEGISAAINFPNGMKMVITGEEAGLSLNASNAAAAAYDFGRNGSFFSNAIAYISALIRSTELTDESIATLNEDYIREVTSRFTDEFNSLLLADAYVIEEDKIVLVKGAGGAIADGEEIYEMMVSALHKAIEEHGSVTTDYTLKDTGAREFDLAALFNSISAEPVSAHYDRETQSVTDSVTGVKFDMAAAQAALDNAQSGEQIIIPLIFTEPEVTKEQLEGLLFRDVLATTKTYIDGTSNRLNNVVLSAAAIDGLVLNPGDVFSFNETVGQRTAEKGYKTAGAYAGGRTIQELGGGICQTSSTLYDAVLYADLEVVTRSYHMFRVGYLPAGHDATVSWGTLDFKFKNSTDYPIRVEFVADGRNLTATLYGTKLDGNYVKYENVTISSTPYKTVQKEDPSVEPGKTVVDTSGYSGLVVDTYKLSYDENDNLISRTLVDRSSYRVQDRVVLVPVGTLNPTETPSETPSETPTETPAETSETPSETPAETSETPGEAPSETPSETSADTQPETQAEQQV